MGAKVRIGKKCMTKCAHCEEELLEYGVEFFRGTPKLRWVGFLGSKTLEAFSRFSRRGPPEPPTPFDSALRRRRLDLHLQDFPLIHSHPTGLAQ